jgi:hypothetical protein
MTIGKKPGIPQVPPTTDQSSHQFLNALKEHAEVAQGVRGDTASRYVTIGMMLKAGLVTDAQVRQMVGT